MLIILCISLNISCTKCSTWLRIVFYCTVCYIRYRPHATSHLQANTCEYMRKMGEPLHNTPSVCAHQSLCAIEFVCALVHRVVKNLLKHHKSFTMAILYEGPTTINLVNVIRNHSGLWQESWPNSSSDSYLPNKNCDEILRVGTKIYRNK